MSQLKLGKNLTFNNLYDSESLKKIDENFLLHLKKYNEDLHQYLINQRKKYTKFSETYGDEDNNLIECAKLLEEFIVEIFDIKDSFNLLKENYVNKAKSFDFKKNFVNKKVKLADITQYNNEDFKNIKENLFHLLNITEFNEDIYTQKVTTWLNNEEQYKKELEIATIFGAFLFFNNKLYQHFNKPSIFFKAKKTDFNCLIDIKKVENSSYTEVFKDDSSGSIKREGFNLYLESTLNQSLHNSNYCVKCHKRGKDNCRIGDFSFENSSYNSNPLNTKLEGCPLGMNISQMHVLNELYSPIAALCVATINNPLLAATGANICNDCSTSCIFQKQETVNTPIVETETLKQVLDLPYGFEIYSLLSRWNPLRFYRPYPKPKQDKNILIVGLGPAGYSLAYNMSQEGYGVVAVDALKLEPLQVDFKPIINYKQITETLEDRIIQGFGGVSEYGITCRWDKNYLKVLRIILERNNLIKFYGGIRFGSNINFSTIKALGFSHIALCTGAGKPNILNIEDSLCKGIKTSSEFLMSLNLGTYKKNNLFNMQIRLPIVVLGGGLTALDCASEAIVYYKRCVEKIVDKYNTLNKTTIENLLSDEDKEILEEYKEHYKLFKQGYTAIDVANKAGGVKIVYHRKFEESRSYKSNAEETNKALKQGVSFIENATLIKINKDNNNSLTSLNFKINENIVNIKAKTLIYALGTNPNNILQEEYKDIFGKTGVALNTLDNYNSTFKNQKFSVVLNTLPTKQGNISISILGDTHKLFNGSVVKALASSFYGQYEIINSMQNNNIKRDFNKIKEDFEKNILSKVTNIKPITEDLYEIEIKSKAIADNFKAGQFFKIQNFEVFSKKIDNITLNTEPIILTGMSVNKNNKTLKGVVLKAGVSTNILQNILKNEPILVSGPLGEPTKIPFNKKIMLIGGGVANATSISIANQAKINNCEIVFVGGYKNEEDIFYLNLIKKVSSKILLSVETINSDFSKGNIQYIKGNVLQAIKQAEKNNLFNGIDCVFVAGSWGMMNAVKNYLQNINNIPIIASLNSPMSCTLKGVCASCLQKKEDGSFVYSCANQETYIKEVNFMHLKERLQQNSLSEKISYLYYKTLVNS